MLRYFSQSRFRNREDRFTAVSYTHLVQAIPAWLGDTFVIFGKMLPAVGFAMLLRFVLDKNAELVYFFVGFIMIAVLKMPIVAATLIACFLAYLDIRYTAKKTNEVEGEVDE